jgi:[ribosomal protein S5]-alanine N-acetyltransferase
MIIKNEKLYISKFKLENISNSYISWLNDKYLMRFSNQRLKNHNVKTCIEYFESFKNSNNLFLGIFTNKSSMIGTLTVYFDDKQNIADIGILIGNKQYQSEGYGVSAWCLLQEYLFKKIKIKKVTAGTLSCNIAMKSIIENSNMKLEYKRAKQFEFDGKLYDKLYYVKYKSD